MDREQKRVLFASSISFIVVILDTSIVNVALLGVAISLHTGVSGLQWITNAYTLVFAVLLLSGGALGDQQGIKRVYGWGLWIFTLSSALCGLSHGLLMLTLARATQGIGAALLVPCSLALLNKACPEAEDKAEALGIWAACGGTALAAGPLIGGFLITAFGWRSIFLVNVPIGFFGVWLASRIQPDVQKNQTAFLDLPGQITAIISLTALIATLIQGPHWGWRSAYTISGILLGVAAASCFFAIEIRSANPMLPLAFFRSPPFTAASIAALVNMLVFFGPLFVLSLYFQGIRGLSPLDTGLAFLPMTVAVPCANLVCSWLKRYGPRWPVITGFLSFSLGFLGFCIFTTKLSYPLLIPPLALIGFGGGLGPPAISASLMGSVQQERSGIASGILNTARQIGECLGVAIFGSLVGAQSHFQAGMNVTLYVSVAISTAAALLWFVALPSDKPR